MVLRSKGGRRHVMNAADIAAAYPDTQTPQDAQREARHAFADATDYWQAMVVSFGEESPEAQRAAAERLACCAQMVAQQVR